MTTALLSIGVGRVQTAGPNYSVRIVLGEGSAG